MAGICRFHPYYQKPKSKSAATKMPGAGEKRGWRNGNESEPRSRCRQKLASAIRTSPSATPLQSARPRRPWTSGEVCSATLLSKRHVYGQLVAFDVHHIAEGTVATAREIKTDAAVADAQVADIQVVKPLRQLRVDDVQLFSWRAGANAKNRNQDQKQRAGCPGL